MQPTNHGAAFIAMDGNAIMPAAQFAQRMEMLVDEIHAAPLADGAKRLFVPGEMEWERHAHAMPHGITLPSDVVEKLESVSVETGVPISFIKS